MHSWILADEMSHDLPGKVSGTEEQVGEGDPETVPLAKLT